LDGNDIDYSYRSPKELQFTETPLRRTLIVGSCLIGRWIPFLTRAGIASDYVLFNNVSELSEQPPRPIDAYNFQVVQISLRAIMPERAYLGLDYGSPDAHQGLFDEVTQRLAYFLDAALRWNQEYGLLTFVCNFLVPQQNPMGRLLPRYDLRNHAYFIERLNQALDQELARRANVHMLDLDQISATFGRKYIQDDGVWLLGHGTSLWDGDYRNDQNRIEPIPPVSKTYGLYDEGVFVHAAWTELIAMYRTLQQIDMVKAVAIDLDDTLWRGIAGEQGSTEVVVLREGWPLGFIEALRLLKKRGILLTIVSKNDEERIVSLWEERIGDLLPLEEFVIRKINWRPKAENIEEILSELNILSRNLLFIDDNPVERASVQAAFPDIRVLGPNPYYWRRILLWSAETQLSNITDESRRRTEMVRAQVEREKQRRRMSRDEFLATLAITVSIHKIDSADSPYFPRAFELLNKSNQFNTTGQRWTLQDCVLAFSKKFVFYVFEVEDRFTKYGLVGVIITFEYGVEQFVMSCRVVGLDVELAVLAELMRQARQAGLFFVQARLIETDANLLCRDLFTRAGFENMSGQWVKSLGEAPAFPPPCQSDDGKSRSRSDDLSIHEDVIISPLYLSYKGNSYVWWHYERSQHFIRNKDEQKERMEAHLGHREYSGAECRSGQIRDLDHRRYRFLLSG
jgi:FkbH-like protein